MALHHLSGSAELRLINVVAYNGFLGLYLLRFIWAFLYLFFGKGIFSGVFCLYSVVWFEELPVYGSGSGEAGGVAGVGGGGRRDKDKDHQTHGLSAHDYTTLYQRFNPRFNALTHDQRLRLAGRWAKTGHT